jgi:P pilus assembly chaperone PapD
VGHRGAENLVSTRIRSPDLPARSESLYRLNYRGPPTHTNIEDNLNCCFTVHFDKYKIIFPTNAVFIKT